ncbi:DinB family protein [Lysinibacillus sp. RC79]|uniref:DinB family protein n=1 Tax=Lysinibacillus sp. RC79 TaxID=3156296 RepID=UPI003512073F
MLYPYRNDARKTLIPYLKKLDKNDWFLKSDVCPKTLAWIIAHIASSEDYWINEIAMKDKCILNLNEESSSKEILDGYIQIRHYTDKILHSVNILELHTLIEVPNFNDGWNPPSEPTLNWVFNHVYMHEIYHIGQIALIAHLNGFQKPLF